MLQKAPASQTKGGQVLLSAQWLQLPKVKLRGSVPTSAITEEMMLFYFKLVLCMTCSILLIAFLSLCKCSQSSVLHVVVFELPACVFAYCLTLYVWFEKLQYFVEMERFRQILWGQAGLACILIKTPQGTESQSDCASLNDQVYHKSPLSCHHRFCSQQITPFFL